MQKTSDHVRHLDEQLLSDNWYILKKYTFELRRQDGLWQQQSREAYDRGHGATILLYSREKKTVVLTRQFRLPVYLHDKHGYLIEAAAGLLDNASPEQRIIAEAEEETGFKVAQPEKIFEAFMSPGSVTEKLTFSSRSTARRTEAGRVVAWLRKVRTSKCLSGRWRRRWTPSAAVRFRTEKPSCCSSIWPLTCSIKGQKSLTLWA